MTSREVPLRKRVAFISVIVATSLFAPVAIVEGGGRAYIYLKYGVPGKSYGLWRGDSALGAQHNENAYNTQAETNDFGFRNSEDVINPKPEQSYRIIAYGGSTTFCYGLSNEDSWLLQLQAVLRRQHNAGDQVLNGGAIMWSLGHAFARAKKDLPVLRPDYVLIYSGINECTNAQHLKLDGVDLAQLVERGQYGAFAANSDQNPVGEAESDCNSINRLHNCTVVAEVPRGRQCRTNGYPHRSLCIGELSERAKTIYSFNQSTRRRSYICYPDA